MLVQKNSPPKQFTRKSSMFLSQEIAQESTQGVIQNLKSVTTDVAYSSPICQPRILNRNGKKPLERSQWRGLGELKGPKQS